jgi:hypothetical protein
MRKAYLIAAFVLVTLCGAAALWQLSKSRTFQFFGRIVQRVETSQRLMYPSRAETMKAVPPIIEGLRRDGYRLVTVSELVAAAGQ